MSRVGKNPVEIPSGVDVRIEDKTVTAKGKLGQRSFTHTSDVSVSQEDGRIWVKPANDSKRARKMWGTTRSQVNNLITGVSQGFTYTLEINGVGYRAEVQGRKLNLQIGLSHEVNHPIPEGVEVKCDRNLVILTGSDKQQVGQVAAEIRAYRPPEPYKGKGIRYLDEMVVRKEGKKK